MARGDSSEAPTSLHVQQWRNQVWRWCKAHELLRAGVLLVAVSGGADSVCAATMVQELGQRTGTRLALAHFHHGLRGDAADEDAAFVARLADRLGAPVWFGSARVGDLVKQRRLSLEAAAHESRWQFLQRVREQSGAYAIATGHTADDQAETVLLHLFRGSGLRGMMGLAPKAGGVIRPLLSLRHADCTGWCQERDFAWREDASNTEPWCQRNRLRLEVLPWLEEHMGNVTGRLAHTAELLWADWQQLQEEIEEACQKVVHAESDGVFLIDRHLWRDTSPSLRWQILRKLTGRGTSASVIMAADRLLRTGMTGAEMPLPGKRCLRLQRDTGQIGSLLREELTLPQVTLMLPGDVESPAWRMTISSTLEDSWSGVRAQGMEAYLAARSIHGMAILRPWQAGDRIDLQGVGRKKLQDLFVDSRIARWERRHVPLVVTERGIACVMGLRVAEWALPQEGEPVWHLKMVRCSDRLREQEVRGG
ncbi:MAG: tRNA lysidine(34) synthetase TilS [Chloroflexi bacterium]|nr:tRNA lysidine(34) synthetase TilS [Chloroflexota bacterium]